jgi:hypothetical protein
MLGDIEPISAQEFMRQMKNIFKEERENRTNEKWFCNLPTEEKARFFSHEMRCEFCPNQEQCDSLGTNCKALWKSWLKQPHRMLKQKFIQTCTTEQLIEELFQLCTTVMNHGGEFELKEEEIAFLKLKIKSWLKQQHAENE